VGGGAGNDAVDFLEFLRILMELKNQPDKFQENRTAMAPSTKAAFASIRRNFWGSRRSSLHPDAAVAAPAEADPQRSATCSLQ
jgi:hypothetical protein